MQPFALSHTIPADQSPVIVPYSYNVALQLNVLSDGRPAIADRAVLLATGTTTSTAGSKTHFDD
ncbi:putative ATP-grasp-modified RiPP [Streptomyces sp. NA02950]|uniref:putative ATP-grasp-modified RiPP n=1 Tax=Streptomyces sp. NA02950 TaxID=2742137 RepID=UPI0015929655|nr:putative ATP-grasp-modified RiPP [Streptomyces sp. NA02950]QKV98049.1 putative ATP-grasp-modified RiPP [Streptomyces sp. NA02950]